MSRRTNHRAALLVELRDGIFPGGAHLRRDTDLFRAEPQLGGASGAFPFILCTALRHPAGERRSGRMRRTIQHQQSWCFDGHTELLPKFCLWLVQELFCAQQPHTAQTVFHQTILVVPSRARHFGAVPSFQGETPAWPRGLGRPTKVVSHTHCLRTLNPNQYRLGVFQSESSSR